MRRRLIAARHFEISAARCAGTDEVGIEVPLQHLFHAGDLMIEVGLHTHVENQIHLFFEHPDR